METLPSFVCSLGNILNVDEQRLDFSCARTRSFRDNSWSGIDLKREVCAIAKLVKVV